MATSKRKVKKVKKSNLKGLQYDKNNVLILPVGKMNSVFCEIKKTA